MITATEGMNCIGEFGSVEDYERQLKTLKPDLVLMDIELPGKSGIEGVKETLKVRPDSIIIMLTVFEDSNNIFQAMCAGATGYLLKKRLRLKLSKRLKMR